MARRWWIAGTLLAVSAILVGGGAFLWLRGIPGVLAPLGAPPCGDIPSWDECEAAPHCNAAHLIVTRDYQGPIWECVPVW